MRDDMDCNDLRRLAYDRRLDELSDDERHLLEAHLESCAPCREHVGRVEDMLDAAETVAEERASAIDTDDLFARIESSLDGDDIDEGRPGSNDEDDAQGPAEEETGAGRWRWVAAAAVIAAVFGGVIWTQLFEADAPTNTPDSLAETTHDEPDVDVPPAPGAAVQLAALRPTTTKEDAVRVFADEEAEWRLEGDGDLAMRVRRGTVLVEFLPENEETLAVNTAGLEVRVIGTVFYVAAKDDRPTVGVITGRVQVVTSDGESVVLSEGEEFTAGEGVHPVSEETSTDAREHVDIDQHLRRLAEHRAPKREGRKAPPTPPARTEREESKDSMEPPDEALDPPVPSAVARLRTDARAALAERRFREAATLYERLLGELPTDHPAAMSARLDLARLYIKHLDQPHRAVRHLKRFVLDRPEDPAAPSARGELCRILDEMNREDPVCEAETP